MLVPFLFSRVFPDWSRSLYLIINLPAYGVCYVLYSCGVVPPFSSDSPLGVMFMPALFSFVQWYLVMLVYMRLRDRRRTKRSD